ncbi:MAG: cell division protein ZapA [Methylococcales bacterium]|nr:MAG: cell division protein ZapA [Methylococcales bacterium]
MNKKPQHVSLMIMGKEYRIACDLEDQEDLIYSAQQLDLQMRRMRDSGKVAGPDRVAVMAALNLAHELQTVKNENARLNKKLSDCLDKLSGRIENVLEKH